MSFPYNLNHNHNKVKQPDYDAMLAEQIKALQAEYGKRDEMSDILENRLRMREFKRTNAKPVPKQSRSESTTQEIANMEEVSQESQGEFSTPSAHATLVIRSRPAHDAQKDGIVRTRLHATGATKSKNPLYNPNWHRADAQAYIRETLSTALEHCTHWTHEMLVNVFREMARKPGNTKLRQMCQALTHVAELYTSGRPGWNLVWFEGQFTRDMEPILIKVGKMLEVLASYEGCTWLVEKAVRPSLKILHNMAKLYWERQAILKKQWEERGTRQSEQELEAAFARDAEFAAQNGGDHIILDDGEEQTAGHN